MSMVHWILQAKIILIVKHSNEKSKKDKETVFNSFNLCTITS